MKSLLALISIWMLAQDTQATLSYFTSFDNTKIAFTDEGDGVPVLLLHGFINTRKNWDRTELKKDLTAKGYRVIVPDLRGNGDSDKPQTDDAYGNDAEVADIIVLMDYLMIKKYHVVGYSRGRIVLAKLLIKEERVEKAVLGGMGIDFTTPNWERRLLFTEAFAGNPNELTQGAVDYAKSMNADLRFLYLQQKYQPIATTEKLSLVEKEVLVIAPDEDVENGKPSELQNIFPMASLQIVPGNHNETNRTKAFYKVILSFLKNS